MDTIKVATSGYGDTDFLKITPHKRPKCQTLLAEWMAKGGVSKDTLAINIGVNHMSIDKWRKGQCTPDLVAAFLIERITKGAVPVSSWLAYPAARAVFQKLEAKRKSRQAGNYTTHAGMR